MVKSVNLRLCVHIHVIFITLIMLLTSIHRSSRAITSLVIVVIIHLNTKQNYLVKADPHIGGITANVLGCGRSCVSVV